MIFHATGWVINTIRLSILTELYALITGQSSMKWIHHNHIITRWLLPQMGLQTLI